MNYRLLLKEAARRLEQAGVPDPAVDAALMMSSLTGRPMLDLRLDSIHEPQADVLDAFENMMQRRLTREPLQYILGDQPFCGHMFMVGPQVLIPRPETELLVEHALQALDACGQSKPAVLDLCCGSGCIGISIKLAKPQCDVHCSDLSPEALAVTEKNAAQLKADVTLHHGDLFAAVGDMCFDVIVTNPPYIPTGECGTLQPEVLREPVIALDGGADGLDFYRAIVQAAPVHLHSGGMLLCEVGCGQAENVAALMRGAGGHDIRILNDLNDIGRMVTARFTTASQ